MGSALRLHSEEGQQTALCAETTQEVQSSVACYCSYLLRANSIFLEYAFTVFADLPKYLAFYLENVQKGLFPSFGLVFRTTYETALEKAALSTLSDRRTVSCIKF